MMEHPAISQKKGRPIPRPWLNGQRRAVAPLSCSSMYRGNPYYYNTTARQRNKMIHASSTMTMSNNSSTLILDKPKFTIPWAKLTTCFCLSNETQASPQKSLNEKKNVFRTQNHSNNDPYNNHMNKYNHDQQQQSSRPSIFPSFPGLGGLIRRHSSSSDDEFVKVIQEYDSSYPHDHYHEEQQKPQTTYPLHPSMYHLQAQNIHEKQHGKDDGCHRHNHNQHHDADDGSYGSVSDFTESETSSYFSISDDEDEEKNQSVHSTDRVISKSLSVEAVAARPADSSTPVIDTNNVSSSNQQSKVTQDDNAIPIQNTSSKDQTRISKPPIISNRSRSAGLPPRTSINSVHDTSNSGTTARQRTDTGDFTRNTITTNFSRTSATTNSSRHRRMDQFTFSSHSISEIWNQKNGDGRRAKSTMPPPPSVVSFHDRSVMTPPQQQQQQQQPQQIHEPPKPLDRDRRSSSDISGLGFNECLDGGGNAGLESWEIYGSEEEADAGAGAAAAAASATASMYKDILSGHDVVSGSDEDSGSPFSGLNRKPVKVPSKSMPQEPSQVELDMNPTSQEQQNTLPSKNKNSKVKKTSTSTNDLCSGYLQKDPTLDNLNDGQLVLSGWIAAWVGHLPVLGPADEEDLSSSYASDLEIGARDIYYLRVVKMPNGQGSILLHRSNGAAEYSLTVNHDWILQSKEVNSRIGRCVSIQSSSSPDMAVLMLPVSLEDCFFTELGDIVSEREFQRICDDLFVRPGGFAPDEQLDSAMYLMFTIDSLVKQSR